jgi:hypothetical protein
MKEEMDSLLEQCNYWGSFLNPVARKKVTLLLGECIKILGCYYGLCSISGFLNFMLKIYPETDILRQFYYEVNNSYEANGIQPVSCEEVNHLAKAMMFQMNKMCTSKRNYRRREDKQHLLPKYGFKNQCDFYYPNPAKAPKKLLKDRFKEAFSATDPVTDEFIEAAGRFKVSSTFSSNDCWKLLLLQLVYINF